MGLWGLEVAVSSVCGKLMKSHDAPMYDNECLHEKCVAWVAFFIFFPKQEEQRGLENGRRRAGFWKEHATSGKRRWMRNREKKKGQKVRQWHCNKSIKEEIKSQIHKGEWSPGKSTAKSALTQAYHQQVWRTVTYGDSQIIPIKWSSLLKEGHKIFLKLTQKEKIYTYMPKKCIYHDITWHYHFCTQQFLLRC